MHRPIGTIKDALDNIASNKYVLPAIQREFVWSQEQVCNLFDTVMQGYPFGELLLWNIEQENSHNYRWYGFVRDYHQRDNRHCPNLGVLPNRALTAILDGQQRLSAFNIGLRGSMSVRLPRMWVSSPYPKRVLALDLLAPTDLDEERIRYTFEFRDQDRMGWDGNRLWFRVPDILGMDKGPAMLRWINAQAQGATDEQKESAFEKLDLLFRVVCEERSLHCYEESDQDITRVLNIFERCNRGGTPLSYSDLLLSTAVTQWTNLDAREEVHGLVDEMNRVRHDLSFNKDFVLKAGLMLIDIASVGFQLENFTRDNMAKLEEQWHPHIRPALQETVELADSFGFDNRTIRATNSLLPIAYYLNKIGSPANFESSDAYVNERRAIRGWLTRSILKPGIWGSGLDTLLTALREVIRNADGKEFPVAELRRIMAQRGKSLEFGEEEIEELVDMHSGDQRLFALLTILFPNIGARGGSDIDHVFPRSRFTAARLQAAGVSDELIGEFRNKSERLANLQLLDRTVNNEKRATLPADWLDVHCPDEQSRRAYCERHRLGDVPREITGFLDFYEARRERLKQLIAELINAV